MTRAQEVAISNPAVVAEDCINPLYKTYLKPLWSVILTVNTGFE